MFILAGLAPSVGAGVGLEQQEKTLLYMEHLLCEEYLHEVGETGKQSGRSSRWDAEKLERQVSHKIEKNNPSSFKDA